VRRAFLTRCYLEEVDGISTVSDLISDPFDAVVSGSRSTFKNWPDSDVVLAIVGGDDLSPLDGIEGVDMLPSFNLDAPVSVISAEEWAASSAVIQSYGIEIDEASAKTVGDILRMIAVAISPGANAHYFDQFSAEFS